MAIADALRAEARELYPSATLTLEGGGTLALGAGDFVSLEIQEGADSALTPGCVLSAGFTAELDNAGGRRMPLQGEINLLEGATMACSLNVLRSCSTKRSASPSNTHPSMRQWSLMKFG